MVSMMIALAVIGIAGSFIMFGSNMLNNEQKNSDQQMIATSAADFLRKEMQLAKSLTVVESITPPVLDKDYEVLYIGNEDGTATANRGQLYYQRYNDPNPVNVLGGDTYRGLTLSFDYSATVVQGYDNPKTFEIRLTSQDRDGKNGFSIKKTFKLINSDMGSEPLSSTSVSSENKRFYILMQMPQAPMPDQMWADGDDPDMREIAFEVPRTGKYQIECWGADGGFIPVPAISSTNQNGYGGYSSGIVTLTKGTKLYLKAGGAGITLSSLNDVPTWPGTNYYQIMGGFNGGGSAGAGGITGIDFRTSGGGGSDVRVIADDLFHRIIVSGGGGGNSSHSVSQTAGNGGGSSGANGSLGMGGTQTAGGAGQDYSPKTEATFGKGGGCIGNSAGGGGGGWYGGGSGNGGGGGSGYVLTSGSARPAGYFAEFADYYFTDVINVQFTDSKYVVKPTTGHSGYVLITAVG